jgi:hypothetical protein
VHDAHRVLDADELLARLLHVALGAAEARQDQSLLARDEVRAVELVETCAVSGSGAALRR